MMILTSNVFVLPLLLMVWALDVLLFVTTARWVARRLGRNPDALVRDVCTRLDRLPEALRSLFALRRCNCPAWLSMVLVIATGLLVRQVLLALAVGVS